MVQSSLGASTLGGRREQFGECLILLVQPGPDGSPVTWPSLSFLRCCTAPDPQPGPDPPPAPDGAVSRTASFLQLCLSCTGASGSQLGPHHSSHTQVLSSWSFLAKQGSSDFQATFRCLRSFRICFSSDKGWLDCCLVVDSIKPKECPLGGVHHPLLPPCTFCWIRGWQRAFRPHDL